MRHTMGRLGCARTAWVGTQSTGQARTSATATPARPRTLRSAQRQRRQAAPQCSPCHGPAHRRMRAVACTGKELKTYFGRGGEDAMHLCPVRRSAGAAPSDAAGAAAVAGSSALCGGGAIKAPDGGGYDAHAASRAKEQAQRHHCLNVLPPRPAESCGFAT